MHLGPLPASTKKIRSPGSARILRATSAPIPNQPIQPPNTFVRVTVPELYSCLPAVPFKERLAQAGHQ